MAHKNLVGGTAYDISGGRTLVGGTGYSIDNGRTLVNGTGYDINFMRYVTITIVVVVDGVTYTSDYSTYPGYVTYNNKKYMVAGVDVITATKGDLVKITCGPTSTHNASVVAKDSAGNTVYSDSQPAGGSTATSGFYIEDDVVITFSKTKKK